MKILPRSLLVLGTALVALAAVPATVAAPVPGIGVHVLPAASFVQAGKDITVQNNEPYDVAVTIVRTDTGARLHTVRVASSTSDAWNVPTNLIGTKLETTAIEVGTTNVAAQATHEVVR